MQTLKRKVGRKEVDLPLCQCEDVRLEDKLAKLRKRGSICDLCKRAVPSRDEARQLIREEVAEQKRILNSRGAVGWSGTCVLLNSPVDSGNRIPRKPSLSEYDGDFDQ